MYNYNKKYRLLASKLRWQRRSRTDDVATPLLTIYFSAFS